jgi:hypothetical protein
MSHIIMTIKAILCRAYDECERRIRGSLINGLQSKCPALRAEALVFIGW